MRTQVSLCCILAFLALGPSVAASQSENSSPVSVRYSIADKNSIENPAQFSITLPHDGADSYSIQIGVTINGPWVRTWKQSHWEFVALTLEYHRNTLITKPQDTSAASLSVLGIVGRIDKGISVLPTLSASYKHVDKPTRTDSAVLSLDVPVTAPGIAFGARRGSAVQFMFQPTIGLQWETILDADAGGGEGSLFRGGVGLDAAIYPLWNYCADRLELTIRLQNWSDLHESDDLNNASDSHSLSRLAARYYFDSDRHFAFGGELVDGDDPTKGLADQQYGQVSLLVRY